MSQNSPKFVTSQSAAYGQLSISCTLLLRTESFRQSPRAGIVAGMPRAHQRFRFVLFIAVVALPGWCANAAGEDAFWRETLVFGGEELRHADTITSLNFSPDGESIISTSEDGRCRIWNFSTGRLRVEFATEHSGIHSAALIDGGAGIILVTNDIKDNVSVERWDLKTMKRVWAAPSPFAKNRWLEVTAGLHGDDAILMSRYDGLWRIDLKTGLRVGNKYPNKRIDRVVATADGGNVLLTYDRDNLVLLNREFGNRWEPKIDHVTGFLVCGDGKSFVVSNDRSIDTYDLMAGAKLESPRYGCQIRDSPSDHRGRFGRIRYS